VARSRYVAVAQEVLNNIVGRLLDDVADVPADSSSGVNSGARPPVSWSVNASSVVSSNNLMASSTACAIAATASPTLEELTAELKGLPPSPHHLCGIPLNDCRQPSRVPPRSLSLVVHPCQLLPSYLIPLRASVHMVKLLGSSQEDACVGSKGDGVLFAEMPN
jgi:hypothetical protein